jgi:acetyltransferase
VSTHNLEAFFAPRAIAVIGASRHRHTVGAVVAENLLSGRFEGPILFVNPHAAAIDGVLAYPDVESLPVTPDLAVIATPADSVATIVAALGKRGCKAAVVLSAGFEGSGTEGQARRDALCAAARVSGIRIIGPNCIGIMASAKNVNASFAHIAPLPGRIACITQSGAIAGAVLDWATARGIGFSKLVSLGDAIDVDFGDLLNFLALDPETDSILLYIEGVTHARKFMAAARAAARVKPVIVLKAGRSPTAAHAVKSHTGALAGADRVYAAAFQRAGVVRVDTLEDVFDAVEVLSRRRPVAGGRLAIITNGGGAAVLAADALIANRGVLASLLPETVATLDSVLPPSWSKANPIDIIGDANGARYAAALQAVSQDPGVDAILVLNCPTAVASSEEAAMSVIEWFQRDEFQGAGKPLLAAWLGANAAPLAQRKLSEAGIPTFSTPERAIDGFGYLQAFQNRAVSLFEVDDTPPAACPTKRMTADHLLRGALQSGREWLDEVDSKQLLVAYGIPVAQTIKADTVDQVREAAALIGKPVAVKIRSKEITHKSDVGGVALDLANAELAGDAAQAMRDRVAALTPDATLDGFTVSEMIHAVGGIELIAGITNDPTFGPVILFGQGGTAVGATDDAAVALPPLTSMLADDVIGRTRISKLLAGYRAQRPAKLSAIKDVLTALARMSVDHPEIAELDINPLLADENGVVALDARVRVRDPSGAAPAALVSYPHQYERMVATSDGGAILIRPIRPEDAPALQRFIENLDPTTIRARFFDTMKRLPPAMLARLTQIDYDREMAFVAIESNDSGDTDSLDTVICGVGRLIMNPAGHKADYALTASPAAIERGIAHALMDKLIAYAQSRGLTEICGEELADSTGLIGVARERGGSAVHEEGDMTCLLITLPILPAKAA